MTLSPVKSVGIIVLSAIVIVWSEFYLPVRDSVSVDMLRLGFQMYRTRASTLRMRLEMPRLEPEIEELTGSVRKLTEQFATRVHQRASTSSSTRPRNRLLAAARPEGSAGGRDFDRARTTF